MSTLYERDFHAWTNEQAALLRAGRFSEADLDNLVEEIESMGRSERSQLTNRLTQLVLHLLKWRFQPNRRGTSWRLSIKQQRIAIGRHLARNPSLKPFLPEAVADAYADGLLDTVEETGIDEASFPDVNPWTLEQMLDPAFLPDAEG